MATKREKWQEIANRGLQDKFDPATRARFDEAVSRGLITLSNQQSQQPPELIRQTAEMEQQQESDRVSSVRSELHKEQAAELNPLEAGLVGAGRGLHKLGALFGIADDEDPMITKAFNQLGEEHPISTTVGEIAGESAPFLLPGLGQAGMAAKLGGGALARGATAAGLGALEGGIVAAANKQDATTGALAGGGIAAGAEFLFPKIGKLFRKLRGIDAPTSLITKNGALSPKFEEALFNEGLTLDNLVDAAVKDLPRIASEASETAGRLSESHAAKVAAKAVVKKQIQSGGRDDALAGVMIKHGDVVDDNLAKEAIRQGFQEGTVGLAKTANLQTRKEMEKALKLSVDIKKQSRIAQDARPSNFAGNALLDRVKHIRKTANTARKDLDKIAKDQLKGQPFDFNQLHSNLNETLAKLDVEDLNPLGVPKLDFKGSQISGDLSSQRAISEMVRILSEAKRTDALGGHLMKRQLDRLINYSKQPTVGLGKDGEEAIRSARKSINESLRKTSSDYASTNDILSKSLTAMDDLQGAVGKRINLSSDSADSSLGTAIRSLFGNRQKRIEFSDSLNEIDRVAEELGGNFQTNYRDIFQFTNEIEDIFGVVAATSFKGDIAGAARATAEKGLVRAGAEKLGEKGVEQMEKLRGINEFNALNSMRKLLRRGQ